MPDQDRPKRPLNILWLTSDQHSSHALGCYGNGVVQTPNLDRLAAEGLCFDQHFCSYPVCVPARFTMMTGLYAHHHGAVNNNTPLPLRVRTVAHHFGQAGYVTAWVGKMHPVDGQTHGFDYYMDMGAYFDYLGPKTGVFTYGMGAEDSGCGSPWITCFRQPGEGRSAWVPPGLPRHNDTLEVRELLREEDHFESFVARETIRVLETYRDEPFFVVASFLKPHNPFSPPAEYAAMYRPEDMPLPAWSPEQLAQLPSQVRNRQYPNAGTPEGDAWLRRFIAAYYGNVSHMDACAGRILDAVDRLGLAESTLVVYTTDHGEMLGEHGLRGKFCFFDGSARLPLIARWPGQIPAGRRSNALVDQVDFAPTFLDLANIPSAPRSQAFDGQSFAPVLAEPSRPGKSFAFGEYDLPHRPFYMRRDERWKYICYTEAHADNDRAPGAQTTAEELYDVVNDRDERTNLVG
ncbi:MAG TPA: sulfatase-like hydrolase/transferase, partial [Chloroflexota bacterium]|nr:sulfatase-like hydrolase/transferase [Chloroflexota bacterium]